MVLGGTGWSLAGSLQLGALDVPTQLLFGNVEYLGIVTVLVAMLSFSLSYTRPSRWLNPSSLGFLALEPALTLIFVWTMPTHGPALLLDASLRVPRIYRRQIGTLFVAISAPIASNAIYLAHLSPGPNVDLTPYAFTITGLTLGWAMFPGRLLDLALGFPLIADAVIVEINPVAIRTVGRTAWPKGQLVREIVAEWVEWAASSLVGQSIQRDLERGIGPARRTYEVHVSSELPASARGLGWISVLRDVTERREAEEQLQLAEEVETNRRIEAARLEGVLLTVRETAQQLNDVLAEASGFAKLALLQSDETRRTHELLREATEGIETAISYVRNLQRVSRVAIKPSPVGPSLDLDRSVSPNRAGSA
jgi:hypothetical protein